MSGDDRAVDAQGIEQPEKIADEGADWIGPNGLLGVTVATQVGSNDAVPSSEILDLWSPNLSSLGIPVYKDQTFAVTADVATQLDTRHGYTMDGQETLVVGCLFPDDIAGCWALKDYILRAGKMLTKMLIGQNGPSIRAASPYWSVVTRALALSPA